MGIRSERITGKAVAARVAGLQGRQVYLITWDGLSFAGKVVKADAEQVSIQDPNAYWYNRKRHTHVVKLEDIREIVLDQVADW